MPFLELDLYEHPSGEAFKPEEVIQKLRAAFPEATVLPGDQLALRAQRAEAKAHLLSPQSASVIVETLWRNARQLGPAYAFEIPTTAGCRVRGNARRYNVTFLSEGPLSPALHERILAFLKSLGAGWIRASTNDERQSELLLDLKESPDGTDDQQESSPASPVVKSQ